MYRDRIDQFIAELLTAVVKLHEDLKSERGRLVLAGQARAKAKGVRWGGSKPGVRKRVTDAQVNAVHALKAAGKTITSIAKAVHLSRPTIYEIIKHDKQGPKQDPPAKKFRSTRS